MTQYGAHVGDASLAVLDNCAETTPFRFRGRVFTSAQAAFEALHFAPKDRSKFARDGLFGSLTEESVRATFSLPSSEAVTKKMKHFGQRTNRPAIPGAIAKKAGTLSKSLGLTERYRRSKRPGELLARWGPILREKLRANPTALEALLGTGEKVLVAFDYAARAGSLEGGLVDAETGEVHGMNVHGRILMHMRREFREKLVPAPPPT